MKSWLSFSLLFIPLFVFIFMTQGCSEKNESPQCTIVSPVEGEEIAQGLVVTISADATDKDGSIKEVRFYIDGTGEGSSGQFPYVYDWNTNGVSLGNHVIKALAYDNEGAEASHEVLVNIIQGTPGEMPVADFTASTTKPGIDSEVQFTDLSENGPTTWFWTFGDGSTSSLQNPVKKYDEAGKYTVTLSVANEYGTDNKAKADYITVVSYQMSSFTDPRDGREYEIVTIGDQTWFAENLNYQTESSMVYADNPANADKFGRLYTLEDARTACPDGWHLPSDGDWVELEAELGLPSNEWYHMEWRGTHGIKMKSDTEWNGSNESGFSALPGGVYIEQNGYQSINNWAFFWTSTSGISRGLNSTDGQVGRLDIMTASCGLSVRCVKD